jgi:hypothetical protein
MDRNEFIKSVKTEIENVIKNKSLPAYFFNRANVSKKDKKEAEDTLNSLIPGKWRFVNLFGNGTNVGKGLFAEDDYGIYISLACHDKYEEAIDAFNVHK